MPWSFVPFFSKASASSVLAFSSTANGPGTPFTFSLSGFHVYPPSVVLTMSPLNSMSWSCSSVIPRGSNDGLIVKKCHPRRNTTRRNPEINHGLLLCPVIIPFLFFQRKTLQMPFPRGGHGCDSTARIEGAPFYRARSASTESTHGLPIPLTPCC